MSTSFNGLTELELLAIRTNLVALITSTAAGSDFQSVTVGGKSFSSFKHTLPQLRVELSEVNSALQEINPTTYGLRVTKTVARFI